MSAQLRFWIAFERFYVREVHKGRKTMPSIFAKLVIAVAITGAATFGADNSLGTWKRKPSSTSNDPIKSLTTVRTASDGGVRVSITGERADDAAMNSSYDAKFDGKEYPVTGANWDTISMKQIDANAFAFETKAGGKSYSTGQIVISKDGKTMTETRTRRDGQGKPVTLTIVYEKQ
jgi:hypothetical protein